MGLKKKKHVSDVEGLVHQNANSKKKKITKPNPNPKYRRNPHAEDHAARNFVKSGYHPYKFKSQEFAQYDSGPLPFPHVYSTPGIPSYDHGVCPYPSDGFGSCFPCLHVGVPGPSYGIEPPAHHGVEVPAPLCHGVGPPGLLPLSVSALDPLSHGIEARGRASQDLGATSLYLKFPVVFLCGLPINCRQTDIIQFFDGLDVVDVFLVFTAKTFSGKAFVVFSSPAAVDFAMQRDKEKLGDASVQILACSRQDYYDAVAAALTDGVDFISLQARAERRRNSAPMEHTHDVKTNVVASMNYLKSLQGQATGFYDDNMVNQTHNLRSDAVAESKVHEQPEGEAKSLLLKGHTENKKIITDEANIIIGKDRPVLRVHGPPYLADIAVVVGVFGECDLSEDMIHIVLHPDGKPTGELFLEFMSQDDAKKAMSKDKTMIGSYLLQVLPATMEDLQVKKY